VRQIILDVNIKGLYMKNKTDKKNEEEEQYLIQLEYFRKTGKYLPTKDTEELDFSKLGPKPKKNRYL